MIKRLLGIRLSVMAALLFGMFIVLFAFLKQQTLTAGQLALFSVNSFLFGYYFNPLLGRAEDRVASLNRATREEAMQLQDVLADAHMLSDKARHQLKVRLKVYLHSIIGNTQLGADNIYYDEILYWAKQTKGEDPGTLDGIYGKISSTQDNRDTMANLFATKIYSHEWLVAGVLFLITVYFAVQTEFGGSLFFELMLAVLCTGLCMLMAILIKYATLTHKEAKRMWDPLKELYAKHFDDVTAEEMAREKARIDALPVV